jgi:large subunit ribosomal protein L22
MKRIRPAPMGRAFRYQRRLTHIILSVAEREGKAGLVTRAEDAKTAKAPKGKTATPRAAAKKAPTKKIAKTVVKKVSKKA